MNNELEPRSEQLELLIDPFPWPPRASISCGRFVFAPDILFVRSRKISLGLRTMIFGITLQSILIYYDIYFQHQKADAVLFVIHASDAFTQAGRSLAFELKKMRKLKRAALLVT
jgi:hypothetical protein